MVHSKILVGKNLIKIFPNRAIRLRYLEIMEQEHMTNKAFKMLKNGLNPCDTCESMCWIDPSYDEHINEVDKITYKKIFGEKYLFQQCRDCYLLEIALWGKDDPSMREYEN